ncbi:hypothetical protein BU15DRAFT_68453 [Melanogaster broomeanus]|nr:hypothetical protein BU15DRAFT_68453 [Melanogaster broomeanus]
MEFEAVAQVRGKQHPSAPGVYMSSTEGRQDRQEVWRESGHETTRLGLESGDDDHLIPQRPSLRMCASQVLVQRLANKSWKIPLMIDVNGPFLGNEVGNPPSLRDKGGHRTKVLTPMGSWVELMGWMSHPLAQASQHDERPGLPVTQAGKQGGPSVIPPCGTANHRYRSVIPNKHQASHRATSKYLYNGSDSQSMQGIQCTSTLLQAPKLKQVNESMSSEAPQSFDIEEQDFSFINDESAFSGIDQDQDETYGRVCSDADSRHTEGDGDYHSYGDGRASDEGQDGHMKLLDPGSDSYDEEEERRRLETLNEAAIERGKRRIRQHYRHSEKKNISGNAPVVHSDIDIHPSDGQDAMDFESLYRYQSVDFRGEHPGPSRHRRLQQPEHNRHYGKKKGSQHRAELLALTKDDYENNGDASQDDDAPLPAPKRRTRTVKENADDPTLSSFYPRLWRAVLDYAKGLFRLYQAVTGICRELLDEAMMHFKDQKRQIEDGYWPEYQDSMARVVWKDIHTFRSEMRKTVAGIMSQEERIAAVKAMSAPLAYKFRFLQGEVDGNGRASNFGHNALRAACIAAFYTKGSKSFRHHAVFKDAIPHVALLYIASLIKGYLDKLHEQGFISKSASVDQNKVDYITMDKVLEKVASNPYHGHKLTRMLENWAQERMPIFRLGWSLDEIDGYSVDECEIILD